MKLIRKLQSLFQKKKNLNNVKPRHSYIRNLMIIRGNQVIFYKIKNYLQQNDYIYFVFYDSLSECNQSIAVYNIPSMYLIEQLDNINKNNRYELYTFDEFHHIIRMDIYDKGKFYDGKNIVETDPQNDYLSEVMIKCKFSFNFLIQVLHVEKLITNREKKYDVVQLLNNSMDSTRTERNRKESRYRLYYSDF